MEQSGDTKIPKMKPPVFMSDMEKEMFLYENQRQKQRKLLEDGNLPVISERLNDDDIMSQIDYVEEHDISTGKKRISKIKFDVDDEATRTKRLEEQKQRDMSHRSQVVGLGATAFHKMSKDSESSDSTQIDSTRPKQKRNKSVMLNRDNPSMTDILDD